MSELTDLRVLVVDDSLGIRLLARKLFTHLGFNDLEVVEDGFVALELMHQEPFDLAVIDWSMPKMSGLELLERIRSDDDTKETPILLVTAEDEPEEMMQALKAGADNYMTKPYDAELLLEKIARVLEFREKKSQRPAPPEF